MTVNATAIQTHTPVPKESSSAITTAGQKRVRESTSEGPESLEHEEKGRPLRKKSRKGTSKITQPAGGTGVERFKSARGKLERLAKDVPLDVIFCHLDPGDLLRLARTSKDLRGLLMSKSLEAIWRVARANVEGLPPRPNDLNEPQYARLIYDAYCYVCNHKGRCENVLWRFRARVCKNCVITVLPLYNDDYLDKQPPEYRNSDILPSEVVWFGLEIVSPLFAIRYYTALSGIVPASITVASNKWATRYKAEYEALETPADREQWIRRKQKDLQEIREHSHLCRKWNRNRLDQRAIELNNLRDHRKTDILARLGKIGWREEVEHMEKRGMYRTHEQIYFEYARIVNQSRNLTEEGWVNIKDELVELLSNHRTARLEIETVHVIRARYVQLSQAYQHINSQSDCREPLPAIGDILTANVFENLIWDTPGEEQVDFSAKLSEHLPHFIDKWRLAKIQELLMLVQKSKRGSTLPVVSDLYLATSIFESIQCTKAMHYPQMFYHRCCFRNKCPSKISHKRMETFQSHYYDFHEYGPWTSRALVLSDHCLPVMQTIIKLCSLDPTTTTIQELYSANPLIQCVTCSSDQKSLCLWWPIVFSRDHWKHVLEINMSKKSKKAAKRILRKIDGRNDPICCVHCHQEVDMSKLQQHLVESHKETIILDTPTPLHTSDLGDIQEHWYFNPRRPIQSLYRQFYSSAPSLRVAHQ
ncbi:hypothetical protein C8R41DRAFT_920279 [Lentinula lateritia]|uniref:F-box domain-containing protein n=1 Tax=Lentinula lateritia TaxID=40482 RepID=A0ABQ8VEE9_9AGAR|nr:hypothetical protein C8R41DRAFT_920279 [Lentinula lateritia]